jgi:uncharacterized membrane protein YecN with MAPEG domain
MSGRQIKFEKIPTWSVVLGVILLCGVLSMAYGFYQNSQAVLYAGLAITLFGALDGIIFVMIQPGDMKLRRHRE